MSERQWGGSVHILSAPQMLEYTSAAQRIAATGPRHVLDWGCGVGQMTRLLRDRGLSVTAVDYRPEAQASEPNRKRYYPDIDVTYTDDPVRLPFESGCFDAVLSMGVLEHVESPADSLQEIARVLSERGTLWVFKLPNRWSYLEAAARLVGLPHHGQRPFDRLYTKQSATALIQAAGYRVQDVRYANLLPLTIPGPFTKRFAPLIWRCNSALAAIPGLRSLATNIELVATRGASP